MEQADRKTSTTVAKVARAYRSVALQFFNTCLLVLACNLALLLAFSAHDARRQRELRWVNPVVAKYGVPLEPVYPEYRRADVDKLLQETWLLRRMVYAPFLEIKEGRFSGQFVNVDENGMRRTRNQGPWPPDPGNFNIFLFGGSTTFGYGVADDQTLASYLQVSLAEASAKPVKVYNFGCGSYYSTPERILFEQLLSGGQIPDMAIFVDGLNEFHSRSDTDTGPSRAEAKRQEALRKPFTMALRSLPIYRATADLRSALSPRPRDTEEITRTESSAPADPAKEKRELSAVRGILDRYQANKRIIEAVAAAYEVRSIFVWQPVPMYKYDLRYHLFAPGNYRNTKNVLTGAGYVQAASLAKNNAWGKNLLWCADIQEGIKEPLYVDMVHYTARMTQKCAECIAGLMREKKLLPERRNREGPG